MTLTPSVPLHWIIFGIVLKFPNSTLVYRWHFLLLQTFLWNVDRAGLCFPPFTSRKSVAKVERWRITAGWVKGKCAALGSSASQGPSLPLTVFFLSQPLTLVLEVVPLSDCPSVLLEVVFVRLVGVRLNSVSYCVFPKNTCSTSTLISPHFISGQEEQGGVVH